MTSLRQGVFIMVAILIFVFALSIALSWYSFGYLDWNTVSTMGIMLMPILGAASILLLWTENPARASAPADESASRKTPFVKAKTSSATKSDELHAVGMKEN